ncbi:hypothetical protein ACXC9Q_26285 (plasmid) [Kribbella sp. CWNU-51]
MARDDLRAHVAEGADPFRASAYVDWVRLADVLALNARVNAARKPALHDV